VAERGQAEEQAGGEEDQRGQAQAAIGDDAEREVDREADRGVGGGEQPGDAEAALQPPLVPLRSLLRRRRHRPLRAHPPVLELTQSRPAPMPRRAMPIRKPTEAGPPPFASVTTRTASPIARKMTERPVTAPR